MSIINTEKKKIIPVFLIIILIICIGGLMIFTFIKRGYDLAKEAPFSNPNPSFDESNLVGDWIINYSGSRIEEIQIQKDGEYKQVYIDDGTTVESQYNDWWVELLEDGRIYLHLEGAKYYFYGISAANLSEVPCPPNDIECEEIASKVPNKSYDWISNEWVDVSGQLILNVRMDSNNELILLHLWKSSDRGFPIIGGEAEIYRKTDSEAER